MAARHCKNCERVAERAGTVTQDGDSEPRVVVTWAGPGEPITLTIHGPAGEVAVPLLPKRALTLAKQLLDAGVQAIKADQWDTPPPA